jgi:two-component system NtrC family response regulator
MALLFIDDDDTGRSVAVYNLRKLGLEVDEATDGAKGLEMFAPARHTVVVTDLKMPGVDGMAVLATLQRRAPDVPVIVITAFGSIDVAVKAMRAGAWDFIEKPFTRDQLEITVKRALEASRLRRDNRRLRAEAVERPIIAESPAMLRVLALADRVAPTDATVLVVGESGVGKELVARRIHGRSLRCDHEFVAVNCAAIPAALLEAELFGHARGAFTGAAGARKGRFRRASGGTLFLDEIAEMSLDLQAKLLRVLEEGQVDVVGKDEPVAVDVRIVAATNQDIEQRVTGGRFREDLFYRLNVVTVHVPPLRYRPEDIAPLTAAFLEEFSRGRDLILPPAVEEELKRRPWRGNVRELRNACERMAVLCPGDTVRLEDLVPRPTRSSRPDWLDRLPSGISLMDPERQVIVHTLRRHDTNVSAAARALGVPRHVLAYRIEKYGIDTDD